jgi:hypothetical protein
MGSSESEGNQGMLITTVSMRNWWSPIRCTSLPIWTVWLMEKRLRPFMEPLLLQGWKTPERSDLRMFWVFFRFTRILGRKRSLKKDSPKIDLKVTSQRKEFLLRKIDLKIKKRMKILNIWRLKLRTLFNKKILRTNRSSFWFDRLRNCKIWYKLYHQKLVINKTILSGFKMLQIKKLKEKRIS